MRPTVTIDSEPAVYRLSGYLGVLADKLRPNVQMDLQESLSLQGKAWRDFPPTEVKAYYNQDGYFWLPRFFFDGAIQSGLVGRHPIKFEWVEGAPVVLNGQVTLDPARGQPAAVDAMENYLKSNSGGILRAPTGCGKCLGLGTLVLMDDGQTRPVEDVCVGDRLMGPDGSARTVLSTTVGHGSLYRIDPVKGQPWVCNDAHVLTLVNTSSDEVVDVGLDEWHKKSRWFKHLYKLFSVGVDNFRRTSSDPSIDPYFLGVWFGDGTKGTRRVAEVDVISGVQISKPDPEIRALCYDMAHKWDLRVHVSDIDGGQCPTYSIVDEKPTGHKRDGTFVSGNNLLLNALRDLVGTTSQIPPEIRLGSREVRLQFLAGFLDADAEMRSNCFYITQKRIDWAEAVWWIARSLGLCATMSPRTARDQNGTEGTYHVVTISGNTDQIPTRIPRKQASPRKQKKIATRTGFSVTPLGNGDYYGFTLDGDGRFLLGDFTVTHNTILGYSIAARFNTSIGVLVYNGHMVDNWVQTANQVFGLSKSDVGIVQGDQCDLGKPITVMMIQSLLARNYPQELFNQIGFLITDESPRFAAPSWNEVMRLFPARYRLSLSADPQRDDGLGKLVEWHLGKVGHTVTMQTAKPAVVQILYKTNYEPRKFVDWDRSRGANMPNPMRYDKLLQADKGRNSFIVGELVKARAAGRRILIFSRFKKHLSTLAEAFEHEWDPGVLQRLAEGTESPTTPRATTKITMLVGGLNDIKREDAMTGDVIFTTYAFARDALNLPTIDTLVFATPPGKPLQPIGRLRDKGSADRKPLLALDIHEQPEYSRNKARRRVETYEALNLKVTHVEQAAKVIK